VGERLFEASSFSFFLLSCGLRHDPIYSSFLKESNLPMNAEDVGSFIIESIINGNLCFAETNGSKTPRVRWVCTAQEQVGHRALEGCSNTLGHMKRKLDAQAETITMLHDKLASARSQRSAWKHEAHNMSRMLWCLAEECVDRMATQEWTELDKGETVIDMLETIGFNVLKAIPEVES
jgi:hypothetical protein